MLRGRSPDPLGRGRPKLYCGSVCRARAARARARQEATEVRAAANAQSGRLAWLAQLIAEAECGLRGSDQLARLTADRWTVRHWTPRGFTGPPEILSCVVQDPEWDGVWRRSVMAMATFAFEDGATRMLAVRVDLDDGVLGWTWRARPSEAAA